MDNAAKTIGRLRAHARGSGPEAEIAKELLKHLEAKYPAAAAEAAAVEEPTKEVRFSLKNSHDKRLLVRLAYYLGIDPLYEKSSASRQIWLRGPRSVVEAVPQIYKLLAKRLADLHMGTTVGFLLGALPLEVDRRAAGDEKDGLQLSDEALHAARTAMLLAQRAPLRRSLGPGSGSAGR